MTEPAPPWAAALAERLDADALRARVDAVLAEPLYWFPIRHHSPAVARHLEAALVARRPRVLFLEAPAEAADMVRYVVDGKTKPPVAIYSSYRDDGNVLGGNGVRTPAADIPARFASWYPLLPYSPEYVALCTAKKLGIDVVFMDLPHHALLEPASVNVDVVVDGDELSEHPAEEPSPDLEAATPGWEHLISTSDFFAMLADVAGYRSWEEAWDSIFEVGTRLADREAFRAELAYFCAAVRATTAPARMADDGTVERERHMWRTIRTELAARKLPAEQAMVACGGFHLFLDRADLAAPPEPPPGTVYVTVAPYSYYRTSELAGYAAGNRAPRWYQLLHEHATADQAAVEHIVAVLARARSEGEGLSSADAIAAAQHTRMLAALRGRSQPVLEDVRDAIITCCVKGRPTEEGAHVLRALAAVEIGHAVGRVTPALGRLPLVHDFYAHIDALELGEVMGKDKRLKLTIDKRDERGRRQSVFFHRLAHLDVPLAVLADAPTAGGGLLFRETWQLQWAPKVEAALIDRVLYGDTIEAAAVARLEEELAKDELHAGRTCERLVRALDMDLPDLVARLERSAGAAIDADKRFGSLAQALTQLLILERSATFKKLRVDAVAELIRRGFGHACFELPSVASAPEAEHAEILAGLRSMAEATLAEQTGALDRALFVEHVGKARAESESPFLRGAFTGILTEIRAETADDLAARVAGFARERAEVMIQAGEFLDGVIAASRTSVLLGATALIDAVDQLLRAAEWPAYVTMLPRLRHAFEQLHERQRVSFCERVAERYGLAHGADEVAAIAVSAGVAAHLAAIDRRVADIMKDWTF